MGWAGTAFPTSGKKPSSRKGLSRSEMLPAFQGQAGERGLGVGGGEKPFLTAPTLSCPWSEQTRSSGAGAQPCQVRALNAPPPGFDSSAWRRTRCWCCLTAISCPFLLCPTPRAGRKGPGVYIVRPAPGGTSLLDSTLPQHPSLAAPGTQNE